MEPQRRARHPDPEFSRTLSQCRLAGGQVHRLLGQLLGEILFSGSVGDWQGRAIERRIDESIHPNG